MKRPFSFVVVFISTLQFCTGDCRLYHRLFNLFKKFECPGKDGSPNCI